MGSQQSSSQICNYPIGTHIRVFIVFVTLRQNQEYIATFDERMSPFCFDIEVQPGQDPCSLTIEYLSLYKSILSGASYEKLKILFAQRVQNLNKQDSEDSKMEMRRVPEFMIENSIFNESLDNTEDVGTILDIRSSSSNYVVVKVFTNAQELQAIYILMKSLQNQDLFTTLTEPQKLAVVNLKQQIKFGVHTLRTSVQFVVSDLINRTLEMNQLILDIWQNKTNVKKFTPSNKDNDYVRLTHKESEKWSKSFKMLMSKKTMIATGIVAILAGASAAAYYQKKKQKKNNSKVITT